MQIEIWLLMSCKFKSLFKHNGLNIPFPHHHPQGIKKKIVIKLKANINPPSTGFYLFWKREIPPSKQSCISLVRETGLCLSFKSSANLHPTPTIYTLGSQSFQKKHARASYHL